MIYPPQGIREIEAIKKPPADASGLDVVIRNGFEPLSQKILVVCTILQLIAASRFVRIGITRHLAHLIIGRQYRRHSVNARCKT